ncbi:MAG: hypothetical protein SPI06_14515 [Terrisporobacter sp.]|uniref:hypothetical protein n=1 Tax=Terrisporobacter sp. TaxID=1965305 RepID=UPI002A9202B0|nr:hypothetical protein [Terrisporobacter sp.]MDY6154609.1 hypothetical protein [Terrisporobacter sp.]
MAKVDLREAVIGEDGKLYCECGKPLGRMKDYGLVTKNGEKFIQFIRFCSGTKCHILSQYCWTGIIGDDRRLVFKESDLTEVKEVQSKKEGEE